MKRLVCFSFGIIILVVCICCVLNTKRSIVNTTEFFALHREILEKTVALIESKGEQLQMLRPHGSAVVTIHMTSLFPWDSLSKSFFSDVEWTELQQCLRELEKYAYLEVSRFCYMGECAIKIHFVGKTPSSERLAFSYVYTPVSDSDEVLDYICLSGQTCVTLQEGLWYLIE